MSETLGNFDPNIRLEKKWIGKEILVIGIALQVLQQVSLQDVVLSIYRIINAR